MPQPDGARTERVRRRTGVVLRISAHTSAVGIMRRLIALFVIAIAGVTQAADRTTAPGALIQEAENLAYFEGFEPAKVMLERAVRTARGMGDVRATAIALDRLGSVLDFTGD